jgi:hypothetical protein
MRPWPRRLRRLLTEARLSPDERRDACAERCLESLFDETGPGVRAWEREETAVEEQRRRWTAPRPPSAA